MTSCARHVATRCWQLLTYVGHSHRWLEQVRTIKFLNCLHRDKRHPKSKATNFCPVSGLLIQLLAGDGDLMTQRVVLPYLKSSFQVFDGTIIDYSGQKMPLILRIWKQMSKAKKTRKKHCFSYKKKALEVKYKINIKRLWFWDENFA